MEKRYTALMTISTILKVLAYIAGAMGIVGAIAGVVTFPQGGPGGISGGMILVGSLIYGFLGAVFLFGCSEFIKLAVDIEGNTRNICKKIST
ncbi:MAG: hypothetical protein J7J76_04180 [Candidatus Latescibacteria bacterium]|nr:hypothetical protein [Candidatus Latescibacterota bacterium]